MAFSDIIKKLADASEVLSPAEKDELYTEARRLESNSSEFGRMLVPGSSSLRVDGLTANNADINDAKINSATAGGGDVMIDGEGIWIKNQQAALGFEDTSNNRFNIFAFSDANNNFGIDNEIAGAGLIVFITLTDDSGPSMTFKESTVTDNQVHLSIPKGAAGALMNIGDTKIYDGVDGVTTVINESGNDIDFRMESDTITHAMFLDAGANLMSFFGGPNETTTLLTLDGGTEKRFEFGGDHYIPIRSSSNPNIYFNEANQDMDFHVEGTTDENLLNIDAGLDSVGVGVAGETNIKLNVYGDERLNGKLKLGASSSDIWAYINGSKFILRYNDAGTVRYKYLDMAGTGVTWVHTTTAP